jgi:DNA/RNA-binding protein KIN17
MRVFAENPHRVLDEFSREFEKGYLTILSHRHGTKRVKANVVYQEYIADKQHIHMNATCWTTLTGFCMYLGIKSQF